MISAVDYNHFHIRFPCHWFYLLFQPLDHLIFTANEDQYRFFNLWQQIRCIKALIWIVIGDKSISSCGCILTVYEVHVLHGLTALLRHQFLGFGKHWSQCLSVAFFVAGGRFIFIPGCRRHQNDLFDYRIIPFSGKPGRLITASGMSHQNHLLSPLFLQPTQPLSDLIQRIRVMMGMWHFAVVHSMSVVHTKTQVQRQ